MVFSYSFSKIQAGPWGTAAALVLALGLPVWSSQAQADGDDHDRALQAVQRGDALSLQALLERVPALRQSQVLEVELERKHGRWVYEIKSLESGGRLVKRVLDARSGEILQTKDRGGPVQAVEPVKP